MTDRRTLNTVERACADLTRDGQPVTFTAVPAAAGLSRSTLYRNPALRAVIDNCKHVHDGPIASITDEVTALRAAVDALADKLRGHEKQLRRSTHSRQH